MFTSRPAVCREVRKRSCTFLDLAVKRLVCFVLRVEGGVEVSHGQPGVGIKWKSGVLDIVLLFDLQIILILIQIHQNEKKIHTLCNTVSNTVSNTNNGGSTTQQENSLINRLFMKLFLCIS